MRVKNERTGDEQELEDLIEDVKRRQRIGGVLGKGSSFLSLIITLGIVLAIVTFPVWAIWNLVFVPIAGVHEISFLGAGLISLCIWFLGKWLT